MQLFVLLTIQKVDVHVVLAFNVHGASRFECVHFLQHWETVLWNLERNKNKQGSSRVATRERMFIC